MFMHSLLGRVERVDAAGILDVNFRDDDTRGTKAALDYIFDEYRASAREAYKALAAEKDSNVLPPFKKFAKGLSDLITAERYEVTIYLRDLVFDEGLFQLFEYYDQDGRSTGGKRARVYPLRYGAIGLAFRRGTFAIGDEVVLDPDELIEKWGWTRVEAQRAIDEQPPKATSAKQSHACVVLSGTSEKSADEFWNPTAAVYIRANEAKAFKHPDDPGLFAEEVRREAVRHGLQSLLETLGRKIDERRTELKFAPGQD